MYRVEALARLGKTAKARLAGEMAATAHRTMSRAH